MPKIWVVKHICLDEKATRCTAIHGAYGSKDDADKAVLEAKKADLTMHWTMHQPDGTDVVDEDLKAEWLPPSYKYPLDGDLEGWGNLWDEFEDSFVYDIEETELHLAILNFIEDVLPTDEVQRQLRGHEPDGRD